MFIRAKTRNGLVRVISEYSERSTVVLRMHKSLRIVGACLVGVLALASAEADLNKTSSKTATKADRVSVQVQQLTAEGDELVVNQQANVAIRKYKEALKLDPGNAVVKKRLVNARTIAAGGGNDSMIDLLSQKTKVIKQMAEANMQNWMDRAYKIMVSVNSLDDFDKAVKCMKMAKGELVNNGRVFSRMEYDKYLDNIEKVIKEYRKAKNDFLVQKKIKIRDGIAKSEEEKLARAKEEEGRRVQLLIQQANELTSMKKWRELFGVTQTALAKQLSITPSTISDYESNRRKSPGINIVKRFIRALVEIDNMQGGWIMKKISTKKPDIFEVIEFPEPVSAKDFCKKINGTIITNKKRIASIDVVGYTLIDSLRVILELPADEFLKIYGNNTNRALVFTRVEIGRSPMVAVRVTKLKPSLVVYQGLEEMSDPVAIKISEVEKIPIVLTTMKEGEIKQVLREYSR